MTHPSSLLPKGFYSAALYAGIGKKKSKPDLAIFHSEKICNAAAIFTANSVKAAPVIVSQSHVSKKRVQTIVVNSGCANACTGSRGLQDAERICKVTAKYLSLKEENVLVASTGIIGEYLPMGKVERGIKQLSSTLSLSLLGRRVAQLPLASVHAMMTTDTVPKICGRELTVNHKSFSIWGCAKGSGMIHPQMATMLSFILTDAGCSSSSMEKMLREEVNKTFNSLSVDGDTSTNDSLFFLANGASDVWIKTGSELEQFQRELGHVCRSLATQIVSDGEGATKRIEIFVKGCRSNSDAKKVAETVATSPLVKTAIFGEDANWGRIIAAVGRSGVPLNPNKIDISFGHLFVARHGSKIPFSEKGARKILMKKIVPITINLNQGEASAHYLTCDFSVDYVKINANYRT